MTEFNHPLMQCGHAANAIARDHIRLDEAGRPKESRELEPDKPACAICSCVELAIELPNLEGRTAKCDMCKRITPSCMNLAFFQYRGDGSRAATETCAVCRYHKVAHDEGHPAVADHDFIPHGAFDFDVWYDGCKGWS